MNRQTLKNTIICISICLAISLIANIIQIVNYNNINNKLVENEKLLSTYKNDNSDYKSENEKHSENNNDLTQEIKDLKQEISELTIENENLKYEMEKMTIEQMEIESETPIAEIPETEKNTENKEINTPIIEEPKPEITEEEPKELSIQQEPKEEQNPEIITIPEKEIEKVENIEKTEIEVETEKIERTIDKYPNLYNSATNFKADPETKTAYLTFDDGPSKDTTLTILDKLDKYNIKATFFVTGTNIEKNKDLLKEIHNRGHLIGIHTYSHKYEEIYSSVDNFLEDFNKTYNLIYETIGIKPTIFRFPGGSINSYNKNTSTEIIKEMNKRGFIYYDWNASSEDATISPNFEKCMTAISTTMNTNKEILLFHDTKKLTADNLEKYIEKIIELGYSFSTLKNISPVHF